MGRRSGATRVLDLLRDGRWHTTREIEEACNVTAHSRIAELRKRHSIEKRRNQGGEGRGTFSYRLAATAEEMEALVDDARTATFTEGLHEPYHGGTAPAAPTVGAVAAGAPSLDDAGDNGWRDLFPPESPGGADAQLQLGVGS